MPIYKKGARKLPGNYRPVSLTSVPCKVFESILRKKILEHVDAYNLLSQEQHGFMKERSCLTNLLKTFDEVTSMLDQGGGVDMIYLDYSKAFDSVPHRRLIAKLQAYGIKGKVSAWVSDFLIGRRQQVKVGDAESDWADVISGVSPRLCPGTNFVCHLHLTTCRRMCSLKSKCLQTTRKYLGI